jgi:hypothetical protein
MLSCQRANAVVGRGLVLAGCHYCDGREDAWEFPAWDALSFGAVDAEDAECWPVCAEDGWSRVNGHEAWMFDQRLNSW